MSLLTHVPDRNTGDLSNASSSDVSAVELSAIEQQKENIQPLTAGRSAKALHALFTSDKKTLQDDLRERHAGFQREIEQVEQDGADDPLDVYHRCAQSGNKVYNLRLIYVQLLDMFAGLCPPILQDHLTLLT